MKTQVHLYVKNETLWTRFFGGGLWFINLFRKLPLDIAVDGKKERYKPQDQPYVLDLAPGEHVIEGRDPRALTKKADKAVTGAFLGAAALGSGGGSAALGALIGADAALDNVVRTGGCRLTLKDGDIIKLSCQADRKGAVVFRVVR